MNNVSKKKIAAGYVVLLAVLLYSLFFVHREMENLMSSDNSDILRTDSLIGLLREKDANTVRLLRTLSEANDSMISAREVEQIIAEQDTTRLRLASHTQLSCSMAVLSRTFCSPTFLPQRGPTTPHMP